VNRPQARNALDWESMQAFKEAVEQASRIPDLRALVVTGTQSAFIAGGDLKQLSGFPTQADGVRLTQAMTPVLEKLAAMPCPTIAAMNGPARGGGAEVSLACDLRVMAEDADLGWVQVTLGLTPGWGAGQRLVRLVGFPRALEWLASGRILTAQAALQAGLASYLAPSGEALPAALELARQLASQPVQAVRAIKRLLRAGLALQPSGAAAFEQAEFPALWAGEAHQQAVRRFLNKSTL
jgi:enoyl-CoA hydratase